MIPSADRSPLRTFQSTLPARGATSIQPAQKNGGLFQSTLPARGATWFSCIRGLSTTISIHAPRTGSDETFHSAGRSTAPFQSTLPARGATARFQIKTGFAPDFNPRSPHGERQPAALWHKHSHRFQSTLPARGATVHRRCRREERRYFNPRSPHGERPATNRAPRHPDGNFNPRSPHGERRGMSAALSAHQEISIHAPRTGSDLAALPAPQTSESFQSTLPARGATRLPASC